MMVIWVLKRIKMKIYVPYTQIIPETLELLKSYNYVPVKMGGDDDYMRYFQSVWKKKESFINVEQDTVFREKNIEELENCPEEWCAFVATVNDPSLILGGKSKINFPPERYFSNTVTLALIKFESSFIEKYPDLWDKMENTEIIPNSIPKWLWCDWWLSWYTTRKGVLCHRHFPFIINANPRHLAWMERAWGND